MANTILVHNFSNFNDINICFMAINGHGKRLNGHYFGNGPKTVNAWELKHNKKENNWSIYFNGHYYMQRV